MSLIAMISIVVFKTVSLPDLCRPDVLIAYQLNDNML